MSENKSRVEKTFEVLRNEILLGQYREGERLPSERDLSARFDVTRSVIRESIKKLEQLGIASVTPGGVRVLPIEEATLEILGPLLDLGEIQKIDLIVQFLEVFGGVLAMSSRLERKMVEFFLRPNNIKNMIPKLLMDILPTHSSVSK